MKGLNWKVRIRNKMFWVTLIPAVLLLVQVVTEIFGLTLDLGELGDNLIEVVNTVFTILVILGVVNDPTTAGLSDSTLAMTYATPKEKEA